ncbi:MAG: hypothetical protein J5846_07195 [Desulfovibrio sp.]|nr:hypothetical protein [Desulfovibrio sp.]
MSITKSYNKRTKTTYAYETSYVWSDELQRKVQKRKCIGKVDPQTEAIVPCGHRGRPQTSRRNDAEPGQTSTGNGVPDVKISQSINLLCDACSELERGLSYCSSALLNLKVGLKKIWKEDGSS